MPRRPNPAPIPGEPIGATVQWRAAVRAARSTCQCKAPECGRKHSRSGGRCDRRMTATSGVRLYLVQRGGGPQSMVVCEECYDGRRTIANRAAKAEAEDRAELFALPGLGLDDVAGA